MRYLFLLFMPIFLNALKIDETTLRTDHFRIEDMESKMNRYSWKFLNYGPDSAQEVDDAVQVLKKLLTMKSDDIINSGGFLASSSKRIWGQEEAEEHYAKAKEELYNTIEHLGMAVCTIDTFPPYGVFEGYRASESFVEACVEYNKGKKAERDGNEE